MHIFSQWFLLVTRFVQTHSKCLPHFARTKILKITKIFTEYVWMIPINVNSRTIIFTSVMRILSVRVLLCPQKAILILFVSSKLIAFQFPLISFSFFITTDRAKVHIYTTCVHWKLTIFIIKYRNYTHTHTFRESSIIQISCDLSANKQRCKRSCETGAKT